MPRYFSRKGWTGLLTGGVAMVAGLLVLTGCGISKYTEPFHDAKRGGTNNSPADVGTMPDGFSNWATKCDHGNRVYVVYHNDKAYGSIAVVANDPTCSSSK